MDHHALVAEYPDREVGCRVCDTATTSASPSTRSPWRGYVAPSSDTSCDGALGTVPAADSTESISEFIESFGE